MNKRRLSFYRRARAVLLATRERNAEGMILDCHLVKPMTVSRETLTKEKGNIRIKRKSDKIHKRKFI